MADEVKVEKQEDDWMTKKWRPMMAMMYMICCLCDFALFPIMFTIVQFWETQAANDAFRQWVPITLQGGGLFHVAMGGVLGVTAYGRTQEKLNNASSTSGVATPTLTTAVPVVTSVTPNSNIPLVAPAVTPTPGPAPETTVTQSAPAPVAGYGGKLAPPPAPEPLI
jgi:hypothetical protein